MAQDIMEASRGKLITDALHNHINFCQEFDNGDLVLFEIVESKFVDPNRLYEFRMLWENAVAATGIYLPWNDEWTIIHSHESHVYRNPNYLAPEYFVEPEIRINLRKGMRSYRIHAIANITPRMAGGDLVIAADHGKSFDLTYFLEAVGIEHHPALAARFREPFVVTIRTAAGNYSLFNGWWICAADSSPALTTQRLTEVALPMFRPLLVFLALLGI